MPALAWAVLPPRRAARQPESTLADRSQALTAVACRLTSSSVLSPGRVRTIVIGYARRRWRRGQPPVIAVARGWMIVRSVAKRPTPGQTSSFASTDEERSGRHARRSLKPTPMSLTIALRRYRVNGASSSIRLCRLQCRASVRSSQTTRSWLGQSPQLATVVVSGG